jgi:hypothetical protein
MRRVILAAALAVTFSLSQVSHAQQGSGGAGAGAAGGGAAAGAGGQGAAGAAQGSGAAGTAGTQGAGGGAAQGTPPATGSFTVVPQDSQGTAAGPGVQPGGVGGSGQASGASAGGTGTGGAGAGAQGPAGTGGADDSARGVGAGGDRGMAGTGAAGAGTEGSVAVSDDALAEIARLRAEVDQLRAELENAMSGRDIGGGGAGPGTGGSGGETELGRPLASAVFEGRVSGVSKEAIEVIDRETGETYVLRLTEDTRARSGERRIPVRRVREGSEVRASFDLIAGDTYATEIEVIRRGSR